VKLYLAGPMTGIADFNYHAFHAAATQLRGAGHTVFNPADNDIANGFDPRGTSGDPAEAKALGFNLRKALKQDLSWICDHAEGIALLEGWEESKGARTEVALGHALGIEAWLCWAWLCIPAPLPPAEKVAFKLGQGIVIEPVSA
jgi:hypothetical protein